MSHATWMGTSTGWCSEVSCLHGTALHCSQACRRGQESRRDHIFTHCTQFSNVTHSDEHFRITDKPLACAFQVKQCTHDLQLALDPSSVLCGVGTSQSPRSDSAIHMPDTGAALPLPRRKCGPQVPLRRRLGRAVVAAAGVCTCLGPHADGS